MEIISTSYINDKKYENCINIKDNLINSIIDYGNVKNLIINNKKYILLDDIKKSFKTNTLEKEIEYYRKYINEELTKLEQQKLFDYNAIIKELRKYQVKRRNCSKNREKLKNRMENR